MVSFLLWYLLISILGIISFPIVYKILPFLTDRGYSFSRIAGLLIWSYIFWILTSLGILSNNIDGAFIALFLFISIALVFLHQSKWAEIKQWIKKQRKTIIVIELLFLYHFWFLDFYSGCQSGNSRDGKTHGVGFY